MDKLSCLFQILAFGLVLNTGGNPLNPFLNRMDYKRPEKVLPNYQEAFDVGNSSRGQRATCPEDYSPCTCALTISGLEITCAGVSVEDIQDVFFRTQTLHLYLVLLTATVSPSGTIALPADLLQNKHADNIFLICPSDASPNVGLTIDPFAFQFTRFETTIMGILNCDLSAQADMRFLNDFTALHTLRIENTLNVEVIETLPSSTLPALKKLIITGCTGLENAAFPDLTPARLERLYLNGNGLKDESINNILISIGSSSSSSSLKELVLADDGMTKVPRIGSFSQLSVYDVSYNDIPFMSQSSLMFSSPVRLVSLKSISLSAIEEEAFEGDFSVAQFNLEYNQLTEFREDVFKSMLEQMAALPDGEGGQVLVTGNRFACGCGLAWLIRDHQDLIPSVKNGVCDGFFRFEDINPNSFINCL
ncbi:Uncharacterized protein APZ42_021755 [Daphnia magna]|uniref:Uncharacterized protein n=1 Tax=Daphnia magna TaxID=35525 RepID=A0A0P5YF57_9CRUS|nr:Uncharacterized protein APZ42_021755 [Daphnia magna]